ncbi:hypothetical protein BGZ94_001774 [Podila epigama]|nr:hypothetical protein BGZ94_001774 [Podila epigama]
MGVYGEKHTSLTREQKRQLIHHADTHKLRPTEVCDWVLATWGLRIARVTVYSILHKQRASLMAGHRDLYNSMQNSINGAIAAASGSTSFATSSRSSTSTDTDACLDPSKSSGRISKATARSGNRGGQSDLSIGKDSTPLGEGARWEGQLKRVREPASVELDRAMVEFLKSSASVDAQGRRLNDAELQSHALRLARGIPSASRMRCSFGWLRHFKRRLGVQWAADRLGRHRWIVEMDHLPTSLSSSSSSSSTPPSASPSSSSSSKQDTSNTSTTCPAPRVDVATQATASDPSQLSQSHDKAPNNRRLSSSYAQSTLSSPASSQWDDDEDDDLEYHSSNELFYKDSESSSVGSPSETKHVRSASASTSASFSTVTSSHSPSLHSTLLSHTPSSSSSFAQELASHPLTPTSLASSTHSQLLDLHPSSLHSSGHHAHQTPSSILDTFPSLFDNLPTMHTSHIPTTVSSSQLMLNNNMAPNLANPTMGLHANPAKTTANNQSNNDGALSNKASSSHFGMGVDGGMRKVPTKDEAYDMLQSLLLYYEQDHHYIGEQQTLLLPRWIHQQRQIMATDENDARMLWMRQQEQQQQHMHQQQLPLGSSAPFMSAMTHQNHHPHHVPSSIATASSPPPLSPLSPLSPMSPLGNRISTTPLTPPVTAAGPVLEQLGVNAFPSLTSTIEQQMFFAHQQVLQQQFALHQQHQQQRQQQLKQQPIVFQTL